MKGMDTLKVVRKSPRTLLIDFSTFTCYVKLLITYFDNNGILKGTIIGTIGDRDEEFLLRVKSTVINVKFNPG